MKNREASQLTVRCQFKHSYFAKASICEVLSTREVVVCVVADANVLLVSADKVNGLMLPVRTFH